MDTIKFYSQYLNNRRSWAEQEMIKQRSAAFREENYLNQRAELTDQLSSATLTKQEKWQLWERQAELSRTFKRNEAIHQLHEVDVLKEYRRQPFMQDEAPKRMAQEPHDNQQSLQDKAKVRDDLAKSYFEADKAYQPEHRRFQDNWGNPVRTGDYATDNQAAMQRQRNFEQRMERLDRDIHLAKGDEKTVKQLQRDMEYSDYHAKQNAYIYDEKLKLGAKPDDPDMKKLQSAQKEFELMRGETAHNLAHMDYATQNTMHNDLSKDQKNMLESLHMIDETRKKEVQREQLRQQQPEVANVLDKTLEQRQQRAAAQEQAAQQEQQQQGIKDRLQGRDAMQAATLAAMAEQAEQRQQENASSKQEAPVNAEQQQQPAQQPEQQQPALTAEEVQKAVERADDYNAYVSGLEKSGMNVSDKMKQEALDAQTKADELVARAEKDNLNWKPEQEQAQQQEQTQENVQDNAQDNVSENQDAPKQENPEQQVDQKQDNPEQQDNQQETIAENDQEEAEQKNDVEQQDKADGMSIHAEQQKEEVLAEVEQGQSNQQNRSNEMGNAAPDTRMEVSEQKSQQLEMSQEVAAEEPQQEAPEQQPEVNAEQQQEAAKPAEELIAEKQDAPAQENQVQDNEQAIQDNLPSQEAPNNAPPSYGSAEQEFPEQQQEAVTPDQVAQQQSNNAPPPQQDVKSMEAPANGNSAPPPAQDVKSLETPANGNNPPPPANTQAAPQQAPAASAPPPAQNAQTATYTPPPAPPSNPNREREVA